MITVRLRLPNQSAVMLAIPEPEGRPDALDILDAAIARIEGSDWRTVLEAARQAQAEGRLHPHASLRKRALPCHSSRTGQSLPLI